MSSPRKPGWLMTVAQHAHYFKLLGEVYEKHGIPSREREAYRKKIHTAVFDAPISAKEIDSTEMFGKIKNHLLMLLDNVKATVETDHPEHDQQRRLIHNIQHYYFPLLNVLLAADNSPFTIHHSPSEHYARAIAKARWKKNHLVDLTVQQLGYLRMDLQRAIQSKRKAAELTVHQMHARAGLQCPHYCRECELAGARASSPAAMPELATASDDNVPF